MTSIKKIRTKNIKNEYTSDRKKMRASSPSHIVEVELEVNTSKEARLLLSVGEQLRIIRNTVLGEVYKKYQQVVRTKAFKELKKSYYELGVAINKLEKSNPCNNQLTKLKKERSIIGKQMDLLYKENNITKSFVEEYGVCLRENKFGKPDAVMVLSVCHNVWAGMEKIMYANANKPRFLKKGEFISLQGKQHNRCIILKKDKEGQRYVSILNMKLPLIEKKDDLFVQETLANVDLYIENESTMEQEAINLYKTKQSKKINTYRIRNNRVVIKEIRGKKRFFLQMTLEGLPVPKRKKDGSFRHTLGEGRIGTDLGTQSVAHVTKDTVILKNLAERSKNSLSHEHKIYLIQRKMDRSKRSTNPHKYNKDGTYKKGNRDPWVFSKKYIKLRMQYKELHRKAALNRKYAHNEEVNRLRALGDHLIVETMHFKGLQKKSKEVTKNKKGKFNKRKRFGKSILRRSPAALIAQATYRFELTGGQVSKVNTFTYKASQYDHQLETTHKKGLSKRWHTFNDGQKVQRDLYSAFLLFCSKPTLDEPNNHMCKAYFDNFVRLHDLCINEIKEQKKVVLNSGIKIA